MELFYLLLGIFLLAVGILDFLWTTLWVDGGVGPLTKRMASITWKILKRLTKKVPTILSLSGPLILTLTITIWVLLIWMGWTFVYAGSGTSITDTTDNQPISWVERIYYTGYTIITLGNGEYTPKEGGWQIASILASGTGMLLITMSVTYILSVINSVTQQRSFADSVTAMGESGVEIVKNSWKRKDFRNADLLMNSFASQLSSLADQKMAYPILQYYYSENSRKAIAPALARLDDAVTIWQFGIPEESVPNQLLLQQVRSGIVSYLDTFEENVGNASDDSPPSIDLVEIQTAHLPVVSLEAFEEEVAALEDHRRKLLQLVQEEDREWP
ncbi:potassium channel family protein [Paenisporosarcina cavernae]|uniref:Two pore domain potassium channel family protein n=1 Tax=Paenisporosarcina cavernae TaxID=2320858 RepID=A0A385YY67_9BACL|nr:potassium channel family protein [Paenisporosarcina cavernae]AYC30568.1 two pore domain potassium channel family protein [Paenisporosarcina cavernae]